MVDNKCLLELLWQHGMFTGGVLTLTSGERVEILSPGVAIGGDGRLPEFSQAAVRVLESGVTLFGSVKIDVNSSDWRREGTVSQPAFDNVILHFVSCCDVQIMQRERMIPTLVAGIPEFIIDRVRTLAVECHDYFAGLEEVLRENVLSRLTTDRLVRKSAEVLDILRSVEGDWPRTAMITMIKSLGYRESKKAYETLARTIPYYVIRDRACDLESLEALLLGKAGYLDEQRAADEYLWKLREMYQSQCESYDLYGQVDTWYKGAVRPQSSPHLQLARMAAILNNERSLFERIIDETDYHKMRKMFRAQLSEYWQNHNALGEHCERGITVISEDKIDLFIINFVVPFLHAYGQYTRDDVVKERAEDFLMQTAPENNRFTRMWTTKEYFPCSAYYSQGLVQLSTEFCSKGSKCAQCPLGEYIIFEYYKKYMRAVEHGNV